MLKRRPALRFVLLFAQEFFIGVDITSINLAALAFYRSCSSIGNSFLVEKQQFLAVVSLQCSVWCLFLLQTLQHLDFKSRELEPSVADESVTLFGTIDSEPIRREKRMTALFGQIVYIAFTGSNMIHAV